MTLENPVEPQMASFSFAVCYLRNPNSWLPVLVPIFIYSCVSGTGFFSIIITSLLLIFSAIFFFKFTKTKQKQVLEGETLQVQAQPLCSEQSFESQVEESGNTANSCIIFQENGIDLVDDRLETGSADSCIQSEVFDQYSSSTSEDSDIDWPFCGNLAGSPDCSDGSISDEESLIEIALPSGHYVGSKEEEDELKLGFHRKCQDFSREAIFGQRNLMELLAEINDMNEEENLIEIDISMGSIKCSRFQIEA